MSTIKLVKYYFYRGQLPTEPGRLQNLIRLAYQTARDRKLYPKAILIRSVMHILQCAVGFSLRDID